MGRNPSKNDILYNKYLQTLRLFKTNIQFNPTFRWPAEKQLLTAEQTGIYMVILLSQDPPRFLA